MLAHRGTISREDEAAAQSTKILGKGVLCVCVRCRRLETFVAHGNTVDGRTPQSLFYVSHPFQTLNLKIGIFTTLTRGICANGRNPASPTRSCNVESRGARGARLLTMTCLSCWGSCRILSIRRITEGMWSTSEERISRGSRVSKAKHVIIHELCRDNAVISWS